MNKIKQAIAIIEESQAMTCSCGFCEADRWVYELALAALREQAEREKGCVWCQSHPHLFNKIYELNAVLPVVCPWCGRRLEGKQG